MGSYAAALEHKQKLSDEEFHQVNDELFKQRDAIQSKLPALKDDPTAYQNATDQLTTINKAIRLHWHPDKNPGMIQKYGHILTDKLKLTNPLPTQAQRDAAGNVKDTAETQRIEAAAPLSPEEQATLGAQASAAGQLAAIRGDMNNYITLNPTATKEDQAAHLNFLLQKYQGIAGKGSWTQVSGKINGKPVTLNYDKNTNTYTYQTGQPLTEEDLGNWIPDPKASAANQKQKDYNDAVANGYKGSITQYNAAQAAMGRTGSQYTIDKTNGQVVDLASGTRYSEGDKNNPPEVQTMFDNAKKFDTHKEELAEKLAEIRAKGYGEARQMAPLLVIDTQNGNAPTYSTYLDMMKSKGRYLPANAASKALAQENLIQDIIGVSKNTREAINGLQNDFPEDMKLKIAVAMRSDDPGSALDQLIKSGSLGSLTNDQWAFYVDTQQLAENAMAMRTILGAGQGSEDMRNAIRATLPSLLTPDKDKALAQLDAFDQTINRLHRGVPKVPLRTDIPTGGGGTKYKNTATGPNNHKIGTNDDPKSPTAKWFDVQTGKPIGQ